MSDHIAPIPWLDVLLIFALIFLNGVLAMSELAIVSSRDARLKAMAKSGSGGAQCALELAADPGRFLSTVQSGITLIAVFAGAFSGASLGEPVTQRVELLGLDPETAHTVGFGIVIVLTTYFSLVIGASALFTKPTEVHDIVGTFGGDTWLLLAAMCLILAASIITALCCLWSRIYSMSAMNELLKRTCTNPNVPSTYSPEVMSFFQHVSYLKPDGIAARLRMADADFELLAWSYQLVALSKNVTRKHAWVNRAFVLGALSLGLFLASAVSYIVRQ